MNFFDCMRVWAQMNHCAKELSETLARPASEAQIAETERELDIAFPESFRALYRLHNGQVHGQRLLYGHQLLSLDAVVGKWARMVRLANMNIKPICDSKVRNVFGSRKWIPFTVLPDAPNASYHCLDLEPARGGRIGQIILVHDDDGQSIERRHCAMSLDAWCKNFLRELHEYQFVLGKGVMHRGDVLHAVPPVRGGARALRTPPGRLARNSVATATAA